ncbi:MAG: folate-binding protein YgfZ [Burkholderiales bacterium]|nr:folate-binding protein YgfZ [Burkholderiales bacterium]
MTPIATTSSSTIVAPIPDIGLIGFDGPDAAAFLHSQLSSDVTGMAPGTVALSSYNSPKGRMLGSLLLWRRGPEAFVAFVAADIAAMLRKRISMYVLRARVTVSDLTPSGRRFGVAGPNARETIHAALDAAVESAQGTVASGECLIVATPDGRYLVHAPEVLADDVWNRLVAHAAADSTEAWNWRAIRTGVPLITQATADLFVPQTANWDLVGGINFHKGCYPGQEIVARMQYLGRLKERLFAFHVDCAPPAPATPLFSATYGAQSCGTVVNAASSPDGGSDLLAVVQWAALDDAQLHLSTIDGPVLTRWPLPYDVPAPVAPKRPKLS